MAVGNAVGLNDGRLVLESLAGTAVDAGIGIAVGIRVRTVLGIGVGSGIG